MSGYEFNFTRATWALAEAGTAAEFALDDHRVFVEVCVLGNEDVCINFSMSKLHFEIGDTRVLNFLFSILDGKRCVSIFHH